MDEDPSVTPPVNVDTNSAGPDSVPGNSNLAGEAGAVNVGITQADASTLPDLPGPAATEAPMPTPPIAAVPEEGSATPLIPAPEADLSAASVSPPALDPQVADPNLPQAPKSSVRPPRNRRLPRLLAGIASGLLLLGGIGFAASLALRSRQPSAPKVGQARTGQAVAVTTIPLAELANSGQLTVDATKQLTINGQLRINNSVIIAPTAQPTRPELGQLYTDRTNQQLFFYDGKSFVNLLSGGGVKSLGGASGQINLGPGLTVLSNQLSNTGVLSLQGQTGALTLTAGGGIGINGLAITNTGVTGLTGTADQIAVSAATGSVTLTLPQSIAASSSPTFANLTLTGALNASTITSTSGGFSTNLTFATPAANVTYQLQSAAAGAYDICTTAGNCVGGGGGVTTSGGTAGRIAKFTGPQTLADSLLSEAGTTVTVNGSLTTTGTINTATISGGTLSGGNVSGGTLTAASVNGLGLTSTTITPTGALTVGAASQTLTLQGSGLTSLAVSSGGVTNSLVFATPSGGNKTITVPNETGTICTTGSVCSGYAPSSGGGGYIQLQGSTPGTAQTGNANISGTLLASAIGGTGTNSPLSIDSAGTGNLNLGVNNGTNINIGTGTTQQSILIGSAAAVKAVVIGSSVGASSTIIVGGSSGIQIGTTGSTPQSIIIGSTDTTSTLTLQSGSGGVNIGTTASQVVSIGSTTASLTLQGDANTTLKATSGGVTNALVFAAPASGNKTITIPNETGTLCTTGSICTGYAASSGSGNYIQNTATCCQSANLAVQSASSANVTAVFEAAVGQSTNILAVRDSGNNDLVTVNQAGSLLVGTNVVITKPTAASTRLSISTGNNTTTGLLIQGVVSQSANLLTLQDSTPATVFSVGSAGAVFSKNSADSTTAFQVQNAAGNAYFTADSTGTQIVLGKANSITGKIAFNGSGSANSIALVGPTTPGAGLTLTLPNETGTVCSTGSICTGYAPSSGGSGYIQLQGSTPGTQQTGNANISGTLLASVINGTGTNGPLTIDSTGTGNLNLGNNNAPTIFLGVGTSVQTINLGNGLAVKTVNVGSVIGTSSTTINSGTGNIDIGTLGGARAVNIATVAAQQTVTIGSTNGASSLLLQSGTGNIDIGTSGSARAVNIATGAAQQTVSLGSTNDASSLTLQAGTGNIDIGTNTVSSRTINIGTGNTNTHTINIGQTANNSSVSIQGSGGTIDIGSGGGAARTITIGNTGGSTITTFLGGTAAGSVTNISGGGGITIGDNSAAPTIQIGNVSNAVSQTINIGTNTQGGSASFVTVGSLTGALNTTTIQGGATVILNTNNSGIVQVGSKTTDTTQVLLQVDSFSTFADTGTCTTTTNQGGIYYNTNTQSMRSCIDGTWEDLVSTAGLGIILFGVVPDTGANQGDIGGITGAANGPCKVVWASTTSVTVNACTAYSGGRKTNVASTTIGSMGGTQFYGICLNGTANVPVLMNDFFGEGTSQPTFSANNPVLCLAGVHTSGGSIDKIYDTRVFTTTTKTFATINAITANGTIVKQSATTGGGSGLVTATDTGGANALIRGVVVASSGAASTTTLNVILATAGPVFVKATGTSSINQDVVPSTTTAGYSMTQGTAIANYGTLGISQRTIDTTCNASTNCQFSQLVDLNIK